MMYRTKITVLTGGKEYKPGSILPGSISPFDLDFLKRKGFVDPVEDPADLQADAGEDADPDDDLDGLFDEADPETFKTSEEIRKIRKKEDVRKYADAIGLDLGADFKEKSLNELIEAVINYQDEIEAGADE